jgi:hypothetical protein
MLRVTMRKGSDSMYAGEKFFHDFKPSVEAYGLPKRTLIVLPDGRAFELDSRTVLLLAEADIWGHFSQ